MNKDKTAFLSTIGLVLSYKCMLSCPSCLVNAGPDRIEEINTDDAIKIISKLAAYRDNFIKELKLIGGEPFFDMEKLSRITNFASKMGLIVSSITNCYWANTGHNAYIILSLMRGIKKLIFSTDVFRQKFFPINYIENAVQAAKSLEIPHIIEITTDDTEDNEFKNLYNRTKEILSEEKIRIAVISSTPEKSKITQRCYKLYSIPYNGACDINNYPVIFPDGNILSCLGPVSMLNSSNPLILGNILQTPIDTVLDNAEKNLALHAIRIWGPTMLLSLLRKNGYETMIPSEKIDETVCDLCYSIMSQNKIIESFEKISKDRDFIEQIAFGRNFFLQEDIMVKKFMAEGIL